MKQKIPFIANPLSKAGIGSLAYVDRERLRPINESPFLLSVSINNACNLDCPHCVESEYQRGKEEDELMKARLDEMHSIATWFSIAGKEPTVTPYRLAEIARIAKKKSKKVILMTNGVAFNPEMQDSLIGSVDYIDVSIDGTTSQKAYKSGNETWQNVRTALNNRFEKIVILTTLINDSRENWRSVGELSDKIREDFSGEVEHSIGFYMGWPKDERLLTEDEMREAIGQIAKRDFKTTIYIPPMYGRFLPFIFMEFGIKEESERFDSKTNIPSYDLNGHKLIPGSHLETHLDVLRVEIDGNAYFGCSHLMVDGDASQFAVGNLGNSSLDSILRELKTTELLKQVSSVDSRCYDSPCFEFCRGGDRLGGYIFARDAIDPFCRVNGVCEPTQI